jgi:hypothetical protein
MQHHLDPKGRGQSEKHAAAKLTSRRSPLPCLLPIALALVLAALLPARAQDTALGGMSFLLPAEGAGWLRTAGDATGLTLRKDLPPLATGRSGGSSAAPRRWYGR